MDCVAFSLSGGVAEWFKAPVLKTGFSKGNVGSNPTPSASLVGTVFDVWWMV